MDREKQIEEMAQIIGDNTEQDTMWTEIYNCANALYNAGYRKASEVRADTVKKFAERLKKYYDRNDTYLGYSIAFNIDRVAKEMMEGINEKG